MTVLSRLSLLLAMVFIAMTGGLSIADAQSPQEPPISTDTDRAALREELYQALKTARSEQEAQLAVARKWTNCTQWPDEEASRQSVEIFSSRLAQDIDKALRIAEARFAR
jgi:hypothetical protein